MSITRASESEQLERVNQTSVLSYMADMSFTDWWWKGEQVQQALTEFARATGISLNALSFMYILFDWDSGQRLYSES